MRNPTFRRGRGCLASDHRGARLFHLAANDLQTLGTLKDFPAKPVAVSNTPHGKKIAFNIQPRPLAVVSRQ